MSLQKRTNKGFVCTVDLLP